MPINKRVFFGGFEYIFLKWKSSGFQIKLFHAENMSESCSNSCSGETFRIWFALELETEKILGVKPRHERKLRSDSSPQHRGRFSSELQ